MTSRFSLLVLFLLASAALGYDSLPVDDGYIEDAPFGLMGNLFAWLIMIILVFIFCLLFCLVIGLGLALGLAVLAGLAAMFGAGGLVTSLLGFAATRRPQVGWRIFSMWMHAGFMLIAGAGIGGFIAPMIWPSTAAWPSAGMGAFAGLGTGIAWGWIIAIAVERTLGLLKETILPMFEDRH
ncbi:MAG: hypothetical protein ABL974_17595 [Prosthecobacter sp.]